jgi:hypothetical protein
MSRDDLHREFGEPGVENPRIVDLIRPVEGGVELVMIERRPFRSQEQLRQIEEKINRYLGFVVDGFLVAQHPDYEGVPVTLVLECRDEPTGEVAEFVEAARRAVEAEGLAFRWQLLPPA